MKLSRTSVLLAALLALTAPAAMAQQQGVTKDEVLVGTILDLSGPLAGYGKDLRNGMNLRIAEANEQGGVNGRKIKLLIEDNGYDPKRAVLAAQKLVTQDKVFIMAGLLGTASNNAALPVLMQRGVINFFPMALARDMYEPVNKLKFAFVSSYVEQMVKAVPRLYRDKKATKACTIYQDDEFGLEVMRGAEQGLKTINVEFAERTTYKRGATDFSSQVARMKAANCDFIVMGTLIRESVGTIAEARKLGYNPTMIASVSAYTDLIPKLGGKAMDGFYATMSAQHPYEDDASAPLRFWANKYRTSSGDAPSVFSVYGYVILDRLVSAMQKTGPNLTTDNLAKAMESMRVPSDIFGMPEMSWSATNHLASSESRLSQLQDGRWKVVLDYAQMSAK
ncbi:ABC transporter substrate-binding protein [Variovorax ginsengisoli]|uniref:Branched-chain amino acid transport system substrate-binding protein n=1 Tax=Variovorax ginsengisoli TaxID=363844 RepID=A0ABT9SC58_9BURK|nr:ABC transporter substrate-binding protein [Variovorax ginsengisoli]MDP9900992.1 branched-chain amino acid transport system substrate-binding protein [Variovorax ginsengisoli]